MNRRFFRFLLLAMIIATVATLTPQLSGGCDSAASHSNPCGG